MQPSPSVFRIDRFRVPEASLEHFMERVAETHRILEQMDGCRQSLILDGPSTPGHQTVLTLVEWSDSESMAAARDEVEASRGEFDPAVFMAERGIDAELGVFRPAARRG